MTRSTGDKVVHVWGSFAWIIGRHHLAIHHMRSHHSHGDLLYEAPQADAAETVYVDDIEAEGEEDVDVLEVAPYGDLEETTPRTIIFHYCCPCSYLANYLLTSHGNAAQPQYDTGPQKFEPEFIC